jgi:16S rRNA processing protein RimM
MPLVRIGHIGRPHGVHGEVTLAGASLTPLELHAVREFTWRSAKGAERALKLVTARPAATHMLLRFDGVGDREGAAALAGGQLMAERGRIPDPGPGVAYTFQLVGAAVVTEEGRALGVLEDIISTGAHPIYVVRGEREILIPATAEVLKSVDLAAGRITVALPAGLEDIQ